MAKASETNKAAAPAKLEKRSYLSQTDVPGCVLDDALRIAQAIADNYAGKPTSPLNVAAALEMQPKSSRFRQLSGAAIAYGLTDGGANATEIAIAPLGKRIVRPTKEGDDVLARREALLRPRVVGQFIKKYDGAPLPRDDIAANVLREMGVPTDRASEVLHFVLQGADSVGILKDIKGKRTWILAVFIQMQENEQMMRYKATLIFSPRSRSNLKTPDMSRRSHRPEGKNEEFL